MYLCREIPLYTNFYIILNIFFESFQQPRNGQKTFFCILFFYFEYYRKISEIKTKNIPPEKKDNNKELFFCFVIRLYFSIHFFSVESFCFLYFIKTQLTHNNKKLNKEPANNKIK